MHSLKIGFARLAFHHFARMPVERIGVLIGRSDEGLNGESESVFTDETRTSQRLSRQQPKPDFDLVKPTGGGRCEVELTPAVVLG